MEWPPWYWAEALLWYQPGISSPKTTLLGLAPLYLLELYPPLIPLRFLDSVTLLPPSLRQVPPMTMGGAPPFSRSGSLLSFDLQGSCQSSPGRCRGSAVSVKLILFFLVNLWLLPKPSTDLASYQDYWCQPLWKSLYLSTSALLPVHNTQSPGMQTAALEKEICGGEGATSSLQLPEWQ